MGNKTEKPSIAIYRISGPPLFYQIIRDIRYYFIYKHWENVHIFCITNVFSCLLYQVHPL